jgi:hypothetical protein
MVKNRNDKASGFSRSEIKVLERAARMAPQQQDPTPPHLRAVRVAHNVVMNLTQLEEQAELAISTADYLDVKTKAELERHFQATAAARVRAEQIHSRAMALASPKIDHAKTIAELDEFVTNCADEIAKQGASVIRPPSELVIPAGAGQ